MAVGPARHDDRVRHFGDDERRTRLAVRHGLTAAHRYVDVESATRGMTVLHATEAASVHLALWARTHGATVDDVDRALYDSRSLVKQIAMRLQRVERLVSHRRMGGQCPGRARTGHASYERRTLAVELADMDVDRLVAR